MVSPLMMLVIVPIAVAMLPGVELNWFWSMVPLTNVSLATAMGTITSIISGETMPVASL